jgi:carboxyl-terminal processing protease
VQALDYSNRKDDGSVGYIPDSLTHSFTTAHGRTVKDGGGITPDFEVKAHKYSRLTYSLVYSGILEQYALEYVRKHAAIPAVENFHFDEFEDFIAFAADKEFDYRSSGRALYDQMKKELEEDGLTEAMAGELDALRKSLEMDKETFLRLKKDEIIPFIEEEIVVRYYFQEAGVKIRIRYDEQLAKALEMPAISY